MKSVKKGGVRVWLRRLFLTALLGVVLAVSFVAWTNLAAVLAARGKLFTRVEDVPQARIGLVFGCPERDRNGENPFFKARMEAAAALWKAGKLQYLIVSGDNRDTHYNEPMKMRAALIRLGVPQDKIVCDYAGLRTLDSVVRAKEVFAVKDVLFITQKFHNERAAYIAQANGMEFTAFNAADVPGLAGWRVQGREVLARVQMWLDIRIKHTRPAYMGQQDLSTGSDEHDLHL